MTHLTEYRAMIAELAEQLDCATQCLHDDNSLTDPLSDRARALLAEPELENVRYEFVVYSGEDEWLAGGDAPTMEQAMKEGRRYLRHYSGKFDGPSRLELRRVETLPLPEAQPWAS